MVAAHRCPASTTAPTTTTSPAGTSASATCPTTGCSTTSRSRSSSATPPASQVLEVGCGTGLILDRVARFASGSHGIDLSAGMLARAAARGLAVSQASATALPLPRCLASTSPIPSRSSRTSPTSPARCAEMARVVRPGGHVIAEFYNARSLRRLVKAVKPPTAVSETTHDEHVFTRYDDAAAIRSYLPAGLDWVATRGIRVITPVAAVLARPGDRRGRALGRAPARRPAGRARPRWLPGRDLPEALVTATPAASLLACAIAAAAVARRVAAALGLRRRVHLVRLRALARRRSRPDLVRRARRGLHELRVGAVDARSASRLGADPLVWAWGASLVALAVAIVIDVSDRRVAVDRRSPGSPPTGVLATNFTFLAFGTSGLETMLQTALLAGAGSRSSACAEQPPTLEPRSSLVDVSPRSRCGPRLDSAPMLAVLAVVAAHRLAKTDAPVRTWVGGAMPAFVLVGGWFLWKLASTTTSCRTRSTSRPAPAASPRRGSRGVPRLHAVAAARGIVAVAIVSAVPRSCRSRWSPRRSRT